MNLLQILKRIYVSGIMTNDPRFSIPRSTQQKILNQYSDTDDYIERSYYQYKCQYSMMGIKRVLYQIGAVGIVFYYFIKKYRGCKKEDKSELVCHLAGISNDIVPLELVHNYSSAIYVTERGDKYLSNDDKKWIIKNIVRKYPFDFLFQMKITTHIAQYSYLINTYSPRAIANHFEYSCSSSAVTKYCNDNNIKHINFMHGEKVWYVRDSFFVFDKCYVWDKHYVDMFISLKAKKDQFIIALPPKFIAPPEITNNSIASSDYCYYLANETNEEVDRILSCLYKLKTKGHTVRVRMHPRWGNHSHILSETSKYEIEVEKDIDINDSIRSTSNAVSLFSTVLFQSILLNTNIIIDDYSNPERFKKIEELDYIAFSFPHKLLSELL